LDILSTMKEQRTSNDFVFTGFRDGKPLAGFTLLRLLQRTGHKLTVHGFRSTFRDWAGDHTAFSREVAEGALAHSLGNATEAAYRRGTALEKRRELMEAWANYCEPKAGNVIAMRSKPIPA
jgi:integrase